MTCQILDGRAVAQMTRDQLASIIKNRAPSRRAPKLVVILIGQLQASSTYVAAKAKACQEASILSEIIRFDASVSALEIKKRLEQLSSDSNVDGVLIQLPIPTHLNLNELILSLDPAKDVDGLHPLNLGRLLSGDKQAILPCTPKGILRLLNHYSIPTKGAAITIVGRSLIVGRPLSILLSHSAWGGEATVTLAHSQSRDLFALCAQADVLVAAIGQPRIFKESAIAKGAILIDVGINRDSAGALCGDIDEIAAGQLAKWRTPVPGGVGPMTVAMLLENVVQSWSRSNNDEKNPATLEVKAL